MRAPSDITHKPARLPEWLKRPPGPPSKLHHIKKTLRARKLNTVCESARCPNVGECFSKPTATFMILGDICARGCGFCAVRSSAAPLPVDPLEPQNIALTSKELGLRHVVITSVTRDDLPDGGAAHFALTIKAIRDTISGICIEVLVPDFAGSGASLETVLAAAPDILNHNLETVPSLYPRVRPGADYHRSLDLIKAASRSARAVKSGIMVGFGETEGEVKELINDLAKAGCSILTIGQYLRPTRDNLEVAEYIDPETFKLYESFGKEAEIAEVFSGPFIRSSYNADKIWKNFTE